MRILQRTLTLTEKDREKDRGFEFASILENTKLDAMINRLRFYFSPAKVFIDGKRADMSWSVWRDFDLSLGQTITIEVIHD